MLRLLLRLWITKIENRRLRAMIWWKRMVMRYYIWRLHRVNNPAWRTGQAMLDESYRRTGVK